LGEKERGDSRIGEGELHERAAVPQRVKDTTGNKAGDSQRVTIQRELNVNHTLIALQRVHAAVSPTTLTLP